ncbi:hypothetical protein HAX54_002057 [Datura stramonium]|uniref:Uncharacterized protein n=1 Tax=Datura stramonium TaxID=4076 RepID=A0ABS8T3B5_DATST|nr:hypothetical protein [Datura stramonium]
MKVSACRNDSEDGIPTEPVQRCLPSKELFFFFFQEKYLMTLEASCLANVVDILRFYASFYQRIVVAL